MNVTVGMLSLGCAKNRVDAEYMLGLLDAEGFDIVQDPEDAQVVIVNTCGFITSAKEESIQAILDMAQLKNEGNCRALIVTGCLSQRYAQDMEADLPEVDAFVGIGHIEEVPSIIRQVLEGKRVIDNSGTYKFPNAKRILTTVPRYAYLKVADGCDNRCAYCAIPGIRGGFVSRPFDEVIEEAKRLVELGYNEIIPIAQDTTRYGMDIYGKPRLIELLDALSDIEGVKWIRPLYLYPDFISPQLIDAIHDMDKVCNYFDLPIQHINDEVLRNMNRRGDGKLIRDIHSMARKKGDMALRTTLICGFPGETAEQFKELYDFIEEYQWDRLGAFACSQEEGTKAAEMDGQIKESLKKSRVSRIMSRQRAISKSLLEKRVGSVCEVVIEGMDQRGFFGRSVFEAPDVDGCIYVKSDTDLQIGQYVSAKITGAMDYDLMADKV